MLVGRRGGKERSKGRKRSRLAMALGDAGAGSPAVADLIGWCRRGGRGMRCEGSGQARRQDIPQPEHVGWWAAQLSNQARHAYQADLSVNQAKKENHDADLLPDRAGHGCQTVM